jgi:predicted phosphodiesterase
MKIQVVSDLHLEFGPIEIKNQGSDVLILSGDILVAAELTSSPERNKRFRGFLKQVDGEFPNIVYVAGNHEFYNGKVNRCIADIHGECARYNNIFFLENETVEINDVVFMGATLWTDCNKEDPLTLHALRDMMNDFFIIRNDNKIFDDIRNQYPRLLPEDIVEFHKKTLEYFDIVLENSKDKRCVVVGHHAPSRASTHPRYVNDVLMNGGYSSELSEFILDRPQIKLWTHGHTHESFDYMIGAARIICNPRGYHGHDVNRYFNPNKVIEI